MAKLGGITLTDSEGRLSSGAAFLLARPAKVSETLDVCENGQITVLAGNSYLVARHADRQPDQLFPRGFELAQKGLDLLSVTGKEDLTLRDFSDEHILWWPEGKGQALRITSTVTLTADVPPVTITVKNASGEIIPAPPPPCHQHHPAFRYYRLSQLSDDLHDAMRNVYLAFELMLSDRYPKGRETENEWLRISLADLAKDPTFPAALHKPLNEFVDHFMDHIYNGARLPIFHAKVGRDFYPPQAVADERLTLSSAFEEVTRLVLRMFESWYGVRRMGGAVFPKWVYESMEKLFIGARMVASQHAVLDRTEKDLSHPRFKTAVAVETRVIPHRSAAEGPLVTAEFDSVTLASAGVVRLFELITTESPLIAHLLDVELETNGIEHLECHFRTRLTNVRQPKCLFKW